MYITEQQQKSFDDICEKVELITGVDRNLFLGKCRKPRLVLIRQAIIMALLAERWPLKRIGFLVSNRDHSTVIHNQREYEQTTLLMAEKGDSQSMECVRLCEILKKHVGVIDMKSRHVKLIIAKEMTANKSSLYSIVGICN